MSEITSVEMHGAVIVAGADAAEVGAAVRVAQERRGRVGAWIGSLDDPGNESVLHEMGDELFGRDDPNL